MPNISTEEFHSWTACRSPFAIVASHHFSGKVVGNEEHDFLDKPNCKFNTRAVSYEGAKGGEGEDRSSLRDWSMSELLYLWRSINSKEWTYPAMLNSVWMFALSFAQMRCR